MGAEGQSSLVNVGSVSNNEFNSPGGTFSESKTLNHVESDWFSSESGSHVNSNETSVVSVVSTEFWESFREFRSNVFRGNVHWEDHVVSILDNRGEGIFVNPNLLVVAVLKSWSIGSDITSKSFVGDTNHLVNKSIEVNNQKIRSFLKSWSSSHGKVKSLLVIRSKWNFEVHWSFVSDLGIKVLNDIIEVSLRKWDNDVLNDHVNNRGRHLYNVVKEIVFH